MEIFIRIKSPEQNSRSNNNRLFGKIKVQMNSSDKIKVICLKIYTGIYIYTFNNMPCSINLMYNFCEVLEIKKCINHTWKKEQTIKIFTN